VIPVWLAGSIVALITLMGVLITNWLNRRSAKELDARAKREAEALDQRSKREQAIGIYKWAAELAVSEHAAKGQTGVDALAALLDGELLDDGMKLLVDAALTSAIATPLRVIEAAEEAGKTIRVFQVKDEVVDLADVPLEDDQRGEEGSDHGA
jgi:hypothetical protein